MIKNFIKKIMNSIKKSNIKEISQKKLVEGKKVLKKIDNSFNKIFEKKGDTFYALSIILFGILITVGLLCYRKGGYFHYSTDDVLQYYPFMTNFIQGIKSGTISLYDISNFGGSSFFSDIYYVPLDIFTGLTFVLSFIFNCETAYSIVNMFKVISGTLLMFYVLSRKGIKNKTLFFASLIYFASGMTQCYFVFPVFLSIIFYVPLGMLIIDLFLENKKYFYFIPLFTAAVIFYNFYIAYMLLAFFVIYLLAAMYISDQVSFFGKKSFALNKRFYTYFFATIGLIALGLMISMIVFLPSYQYIINETFRTQGKHEIWKFKKEGHYFTIFINYFLPNEPHRLMLIGQGDYVKEHVTYFATIVGFVFLCYYFTFKGKEHRRLQGIIVVLNILSFFPIVSTIMSGNTAPYIRWFFIVFLFNFLGIVKAMDAHDMKVECSEFSKRIIQLILFAGLIALLYVYFGNDKYSIHMKTTDELFKIFLIPIIMISVYLFIFEIFEKHKFRYFLYLSLVIEFIAAVVLIFGFVERVNEFYYVKTDRIDEVERVLQEQTNYKKDNIYRVNFDDWATKDFTNTSKIGYGFNYGSFFHSFYDADLYQLYGDVFGDSDTFWSKRGNELYNIYSGTLFNLKYVITNKDIEQIELSSKHNMFHKQVFTDYIVGRNETNTYNYYELEGISPFIVYNDCITNISGLTLGQKQELLLRTAYVSSKDAKSEDEKQAEILKLQQKNIKVTNKHNNNHYDIQLYANSAMESPYGKVEKIGGNTYYVYTIPASRRNKQMIQVIANNSSVRKMAYEEFYILDTEYNEEDPYSVRSLHRHNMHYNTAYIEGYEPDKLYMRVEGNAADYVEGTTVYGVNITYMDLTGYEKYVEEQSVFTNKSMTLNGSNLNIKFDMPKYEYARIVKTPYSYSEDWKVKNSDFETISVAGGFLGVIIPENITSVDIDLTFEPAGFKAGALITTIGILMFGLIMGSYFYIIKMKMNKVVTATNGEMIIDTENLQIGDTNEVINNIEETEMNESLNSNIAADSKVLKKEINKPLKGNNQQRQSNKKKK